MSKLLIATLVGLVGLRAQEAERLAIPSRANEIEIQREEKAREVQPETQVKGERVVSRIMENRFVKALTAEQNGFAIKLGGLVTGSGMAAGPEYVRHDLANDTMTFRVWASASVRKFWLAQTELEMPKLAHNWLFADLAATHRDYPEIGYFGPGPHSANNGETSWALQDTWLTAHAGVRPLPHIKLGAIGRYLVENIGPGHSVPASDQLFTPETTPGLLAGADFLQAGSFLQVDYRDRPGEPRKGGMYWLDFSSYSDVKFGRYSFDRADAEVQQYIPFLNGTHVIALHGRTSFTDPHSGNIVPFYLQPTLGGPDTLRGFDPFRFYDNNLVLLNAEYRWQLYEGLDGALFMDAGRVFPKWQQISLHDLEKSYGFGLRFLSGGKVFLRCDVGFSHEGFQIWFKFGNVFGSGYRNFDNFY